MSNRSGISPDLYGIIRGAYTPVDEYNPFELTDEEKRQLGGANPAAQQEGRTFGEAISDTGAAVMGGFASLGGSLTHLGDTVTGGVFDIGAREAFDNASKFWEEAKSDELKRQKAEVHAADGFVDTVGAMVVNPATIADLLAGSLPHLLPVGIAAKAGKGLALAQGMKAVPLTAEAAAALGTRAAGVATTTGMVTGGVLEGADAGSQAYNDAIALAKDKTPEELISVMPAYKMLIDEGMSHEDAVAGIAYRAGLTAQMIATPIAILASKVTGAAKLEADLFTGAGIKGWKNGALGVAREGVEEVIQEGGNRFGQNVGVNEFADPTRGYGDDVADSAAMGLVAGVSQGGGIYGLNAVLGRGANSANAQDDGIDDGIGSPTDGSSPSPAPQLQTNVDTTTHIPSVDEIGIVDDLPPASPLISTGDSANPDDRFKFELNTESLRTRIQNIRAKRREEMNRANHSVDFAPVQMPEVQAEQSPAAQPDAIEFNPPEISQPEKFTLAPTESNYSNGVDFTPTPESRTNDLAAGVEQAISKNIDSARSARMPENLKDTRLLRNRYRTHLTNVAESLDSNAGAFSSPDSLLDMAAKNGGLNAAAWAKEGIDPADAKLVNNASYAKAFRQNGGMTPDDLAEFAAQRGFSGFANTQGTPDANAALNAINEELAGKKRYSAEDETALQAAQSAPAYISELKEFGSPEAIKRAITLALDGKKLGENQMRIVQEVLNNTNTHSRDDKTIKEKWADRAKTMLANRGNKELNSWRNRDEHAADATTHEAALNEIMTDAVENYGIDPDAVKNAYRTYAEKYPTQGQLTAAMTSWVSANKPNTSEHLSYERQNRKAELSGRSPSQRGAALPGAGLSLESEGRQEASKPRVDAPSPQAEPRSDSAGRDAGLRQSVDSGTDENQLPPLAEGFEKSLLRARPLAKKLGIPNYNQMKLAELVPAINAVYESKKQKAANTDNQAPINKESPVAAMVAADSVEINQEPVKEKPKSIEGKNIDDDWAEFSGDSGTLKIPRAEMPQIKAEHRGAMVNFLNARGVEYQEENVPADSLKPTQAEFSREKVAKAKGFEGGNRSILISSDNHVLDGHHQWMAARDNGEDVKVIRLDAPIKKLVDLAHEFPSSTTDAASEQEQSDNPKSSPKEVITDFGEKIGGARKDKASSGLGTKRNNKSTDERPAWMRRFRVSEIVHSQDESKNGKWIIDDMRKLDGLGRPRRMSGTYDTEEAAEEAIPLLAVAQKHRVVAVRQGETGFEIWRDISDRKRVKVVNQVFETRNDAMEYMVKNAEKIITTNTTFGEADLPRPDSTTRTGVARRTVPAKDSDFIKTFGFRGVEFGNWNNQEDRQNLLDDAYDGLLDLAEVMGIPPNAISLNGDLGLAFGARGQGLSGARAHYEPGKVVINLTKMNGAGSLAHEWFHALDHYFGRQDGKASSEWIVDPKDGSRSLKDPKGFELSAASSGFRRNNSGVRQEVRDAYTELMKTMFTKAEQYVEDTVKVDNFVARSRKDVAERLDYMRRDLAEQKDPKYWKRNNKPATTEQLAEFDTIAQQITEGVALDTELREVKNTKGVMTGMRWTNDALERLSEINKAVRGRTGFSSDGKGDLDRMRGLMGSYSARLKMLAEAQSETTKTKNVLTEFAMNAKELDQGRGGDYWTSPHEMAARAFQGYVEDKIAEGGGKSPFLNHAPENAIILTPWGWKRPYPHGNERKAINAAFDKLVNVLETKDGKNGNTILYKLDGKATKSISRESAQAVIDRISKDWKVKVKINLIGSIDELPDSVKSRLHKADDEQGEPAALIDKSTGHVYINLSKAASERSIEELIFHEVYTHFGLRQLMGAKVSGLMTRLYLNLGKSQFDAMAKKYGVNTEAYREAYKEKPEEYIQAILAEELLAHMAEHPRPAIVRIANEFIGAVRAWLRESGFMELASISENDMRYLLKQSRETVTKGKQGNITGFIYSLAGISKADRKAINAERNRAAVNEPQDGERNVNEDLITMWATISRDVESFQLPFSRKKDFVEIAQELEGYNGFKSYEADELALMNNHKAENAWRVVTPKGEKAAVFQKGDKVWIDVSDLETGEGGRRIYNMVANYAYNNNKVFIGDPAGLSITAKSRRLENMISSALKFGTTDHLQPHRLQLVTSHGVPGLKWKKGDTENNILEMIRASYESVKNQFPEIENMIYNPEEDEFQYRDSGKEVAKDELDKLAGAARAIDVSTDSSMGRESRGDSSRTKITAGRTTIERAILTGSILRGTSSEVSRLLDKLSEQRSERLTGDNAILYSLPNTQTRSQGGFSVSGLQENKNTFGISVDGILRVWQDKMRPLLRTQEAIKKDGGGISENENAYLAEEAFHGKTENDLRKMRERFLEPMSKKMADNNIEREELDMYLWAKHAEERNAQIAKINSEMPDGGSGMTNAQAKQILKQAKTDGKQAILDDLASTVYALLAEKRKIARYLSGDEVVDTWNSVYQHYVPLKGRAVDDSGADFPRVGRGFDIRGSESLRALGRRTKPESPTLHAIKDTTEAIIRYRKNEVGNALLALVEANPNPEYWEAHDASSPDFERKLLKKAGKEYVGQAKVINKEDYFITKREGKEFYIRLEDPMLLRAMKNMGPEKMNWAMQHLAKASRFLSAMCTSYNPEFVITNFARDIQTAIINLQAEIDLHDGKVKGKQITGKMIKGVPFAMRSVYASLKGKRLTGDLSEWQKYFDDFRNDGANTGWFQLQDIDQQADELETLINSQKKNAVGFALRLKKKIGDFVANGNGAVESAIRLSVYKSAIEAGVSRKQAASLAKNLTVNFNRKGEIGASMNAAYMFFNAAVQGTASLARALGTLKIDADGKRSLNMAQKVALGVMVAAFGLAALNRSAAGEDDDEENWWDKVPAHEKERNIIIMKAVLGGPKDGTYWKIPLPYGYNIFNAVSVSTEGAVNGKKGIGEASGEILKAMLGAFSPIGIAHSETLAGGATRTLAPTVLKPLADLAANENFFGSKIFAENMDFDTAKPNSHLSMRSTNDAWKWISEALNDNTGGSAYRSGVIDISPDKMGYIFNYFVGSAGAFYSTAAHDGIKLSEGREIKTKEIPFVRRLSGAVDWHKDQNTFYERKEELEQIRDEYKSMPFGAEKTKFLERYRDEIQLAARAKIASVSLSHVRKQKNRINDNPSLSDKQKDEALDPLDLRMKGTVDRFNALYSDKLNR